MLRRVPSDYAARVAETAAPTWHQALVFAVTGERRPELGRQADPDLGVVVDAVRGRTPGAHVVPADLTRHIGAAQLAAVLVELRRRLSNAAGARPVLAERDPDAAERRLLGDVPPHHGS